MNNKINLTYNCRENWDKMSLTEQGRHCEVCSRHIVDFAGLNKEELTAKLSSLPENSCGRFRIDQVAISGHAEKNKFRRFRLKYAAILALVSAKFFSSLDASAQDSLNVSKADPDNEKLKNQKKLYGDSTIFHVMGYVNERGKKKAMNHAAVEVKVNGVKTTYAYTSMIGKFELNIPVANGGDKIVITISKRRYKDIVISNYVADGELIFVKMRKSLKGRFQRHSYVVGRYRL